MTPAVNIAKRAGIAYQLHDYEHSPDSVSYGLEAAQKLGQDPNQVFKTLVIQWEDNKLAVGIVPVCTTLNPAVGSWLSALMPKPKSAKE